MKIKKLNESLLKEADGAVVIDNNDSGKEVLDKVEKEVDASNLKTNPAELAGEVAAAGDKINAEETVVDLDKDTGIGVKNFITDALDECLETALDWKEEGSTEVANIMICGLPGSGKTASVYDWSKRTKVNGKAINLVYLNMKNNDLEAFINGYPVQSKDNPDYIVQAYSRNLDSLDKDYSILLLDEYNRQTEDQIRASVLTLINEHYIVGKDENGRRYFPNFLFTIAIMNPAVRTDRGAANLNDAEKTRFLYYFDNIDSDPDTTIEFLNKYYLKRINEEKAKEHPNFDKIEKYLRIVDLGTWICNDETFEYDGKDKLSELANSGKKMLNQRALTTGIAAAKGDVEKFKNWLLRGANFLDQSVTGQDNTTEMLLEIIKGYATPTREDLFADAGIEEPKAVAADNQNNVDNQANNEQNKNSQNANSEIEDDDDPEFWDKAAGAAAASAGVKSAKEIEDIINGFTDSWS